MAHLSDSGDQREAEALIVQSVGERLGVELVAGGRIDVGGGSHVQVDARTTADDVLVEAYARIGALKGAQLKKVAQDVLKFALLRRVDGWEATRMILAFASPEAKDSVRGWLLHAAETFGAELVVVELPIDVAGRVVEAQQRQVMVNVTPDEAEILGESA